MMYRKSMQTFREVLALSRNGYSGPFFVGTTLLGMGIWLMLPWDTFPSSPVYDFMEEQASEFAWGVFMVLTSLIMVASSLVRKPREVALAALLAAGVWFAMFCSFALGNPPSITVPFTFVMFMRSLSIHREFKFYFDPITGEAYIHQQKQGEHR